MQIDAQCKLGDTSGCIDLELGDEVPFRPGERPGLWSYRADAYAQCPACDLDFGVAVVMESHRVARVEPAPRTLVHRADATLVAPLTCPRCGGPEEKEVSLYVGRQPCSLRLGDRYPPGARAAGAAGWVRGRARCACGELFAVKVFLDQEVLRSVTVDPHQREEAEDLL